MSEPQRNVYVRVGMPRSEYSAYLKMCQRDFRSVDQEARYLIVQAMVSRGFVQYIDNVSESVVTKKEESDE